MGPKSNEKNMNTLFDYKKDFILLSFLLLICCSTIFSRFLLNLLIVFSFFFILFISSKKNNWDYLKSDVAKYILIFFFYILLTNIFYHDINLKVFFKLIWILAIIFLILAIPDYILLLNKKSKIYFTVVFFILVLFVQFDTLYQFFNPNFEDILGFKSGDIRTYSLLGKNITLPIRLTGPFNGEQVVGFYLSTYGLLSIYLLKRILKISLKMFYGLIFFNFLIIILSGERSSIIIYLITILLFKILIPSAFYKKLLFITSVVLFTIISLLNIPTTKERFNDINVWLNLDNENVSLKENNIVHNFLKSPYGGLWSTSYYLWKKKPFVGIGLRNYSKLCPQIKNEVKIQNKWGYCSVHPHNYLIEILTETGIIGLLLFLTIIFKMLSIFIKSFRSNVDMILLVSFLVALLMPFKPSGAIFSSWYGSFFWFSIGLFLLLEKNKVK
tara:strand:+ start:805 stop:2130 length:1326 start_codon:yes stop_codon:yes gene_type:complete